MRVVAVLLNGLWDRNGKGTLAAGAQAAELVGAKLEAVVPASMGDDLRTEVAGVVDLVSVLEGIDLNEVEPESIVGVLRAKLADDVPACIVFGDGAYAQEIAPRLAFRLGGVCVGDVQGMRRVNEGLCVSRSAYGGKAVAELAILGTPAVLSVRARSFGAAAVKSGAGEIRVLPACESEAPSAKRVERQVETSAGVKLEDATVIVSGGRGLGSAEPFDRLQKLAEVMSAEMAASRAACDLGWVPHSWQVGQTGKKVAPELYLAIALSGSSQHLMGIADAKTIAAINTDPEAPIFKHCRFGIVEDYDKVVDLLRTKLEEKLK